MNEKEALLAAIRDRPFEDAPRLMLADWLAEHEPDDPITAPTVEFVGIACRGRGGSHMPQAAYKWLDANWQRLIPSVLALHDPPPPGTAIPIHGHPEFTATEENKGLPWTRTGRMVWMKPTLSGRGTYRSRRTWTCSVQMQFFKGFCGHFRMFSPWAFGRVKEAFKTDQPLAQGELLS